MMLTVTKLAKSCNLARSTVLYYESIGLLRPPRRSDGNYRVYASQDLDRLRQICTFRDAGLTLGDIRSLLNAPRNDAQSVLERRMVDIGQAIERMREHQRAIARLLNSREMRKDRMITKEKWTSIMSRAGFSEDVWSALAEMGIHLTERQMQRAAEQDAQGRRKLPFFVDPIQHKLMIEKDDLLSAYFQRQVEAQRNLRPS